MAATAAAASTSVHLYRRTALRALARFVRLHQLRLGERDVEVVTLVLGMSASGALDAHPQNDRDLVSMEALRRSILSVMAQ
jgi:hypothetical protein